MLSESHTKVSAAVPLYQQVKQFIEARIISGEWSPDTKIPSENELVTELGASRMTVNRAFRELASEGHLTRVQGVGTFVAAQKPQSALLEIKSISEEIQISGGIHSSEIHLLKKEKANLELAKSMELKPGSSVYHSIIVHKDRNTAIQFAERYVNPAIAPDYIKQDFTKITPSEYLLNVAPITEVEHVVEAILPDKKVQKILSIKSSEPCLLLLRRTWVKGIVATRNRFIYPGSRYRIGGRFTPSTSNRGLMP